MTSINMSIYCYVCVRVQSAEALGAIGLPESVPILQKYVNHDAPEIAETCQIAIDLIRWRESASSSAEAADIPRSLYLSVDPAPALPLPRRTTSPPSSSSSAAEQHHHHHHADPVSVEALQHQLVDAESSLFHRYRAMFTLRDMNSDAAALALVEGILCDRSSALFRHEVAYVLGQMQRAVTVPGLSAVLRDAHEHRMVRHEAAEALGAIGGDEVEQLLKLYHDDAEDVVRESAIVALDTMDYWSAVTVSASASSSD